MEAEARVEELLASYVERHVACAEVPSVEELCRDDPELRLPLAAAIHRYLELSRQMDGPSDAGPEGEAVSDGMPSFRGFRTVERLGRGGMGEVYKLRDLELDRTVAAKVIRADAAVAPHGAAFLGEARALALFKDPRIVQIHELRLDATPPVIIMEHVDGFELSEVGPSLEYPQRARIVMEVCEAVHHAHELGLQHRDLKPANIMLDAKLQPKILDFGLAGGDPSRGHLLGTPAYLAPEQLDPDLPIDGRADVYALGVILYELLCGARPFDDDDTGRLLEAVRAASPRLPVEIAPTVPEPLQAIALKAMERDPTERYASARDMALDLRRYLEGRPVLARPSQYASALSRRLRAHLTQIEEWLALNLIYPHEAHGLRKAYRVLEARDDDWIVESRRLSYSQIALYLGAFLLFAGGVLYFGAHRFYEAVEGVVGPTIVLGVPFAGLNLAGGWLYRRQHRAVAVAAYLGGVALLPLYLLIVLHEMKLFAAPLGDTLQLFEEGIVSNRQLQVTALLACAWSYGLARRTGTTALATLFTVLGTVLALCVLTDLGLRVWLEDERWDLLALHLVPLPLLLGLGGRQAERGGRPWLGRPLYLGALIVAMISIELLALDGRLFSHLGFTLAALARPDVGDPTLLDTLTAMSCNGALFYLGGVLLDRRGTVLLRESSRLLFVVSPFAILEPIAYLVHTGDYAPRFDVGYLVASIAVALLSHQRQLRSFYYAGIVNTGVALWYMTDHRGWFDRPLWAMAVVAVGLLTLLAGYALDLRERARHQGRG